MKRFLNSVMIVAAVVSAAVSCQKSGLEPDGGKLILSASNPEAVPVSKTVLNGTAVYWNAGDAIGVTDAASTPSNDKFTSTLTSSAAVSEFSGKSLSGTFYAYYPYTGNGVSAKGAKIDIPAEQKPSATSFDGDADLLVSKSFTVSSSTKAASLEFTRATAVVKVVMKDNDSQLGGEKVKSLSLTADVDLVGRCYVNFANQAIDSLYYGTSKKVSAVYENPSDRVSVNGTDAVYVCVAPATLAAGSSLKLEAVTDSKTITKDITVPAGGIVFEAGKVTTLNIGIATSNVSATAKGLALPLVDRYSWNKATSDGTAVVGTDVFVDESSRKYVSTVDRIYLGASNSIKFGTSSYAGSFKTVPLDLSSDFKVVLKTKKYSSDSGIIKVTVDGDASTTQTVTPSSSMSEVTLSFEAATSSSYITVETSEKRAYLGEFIVAAPDYVLPAPDPVITITSCPTAVAAAGDVATVKYSVANPVAGKSVTASSSETWVNTFDYSTSGEVSFIVDANTGAARNATVTLSYEGAENVSFTLSQNAPGAQNNYAYLFKSAKWTATLGGAAANWTSGKDGAGYSNNGVQVTKTGTGANATCATSYSKVSKIVISYCTNKSDGAGTVTVSVGTSSLTQSVTKTGGTAARDLEFDFSSTKPSGAPKISVECTTNSIYICGCTITAD